MERGDLHIPWDHQESDTTKQPTLSLPPCLDAASSVSDLCLTAKRSPWSLQPSYKCEVATWNSRTVQGEEGWRQGVKGKSFQGQMRTALGNRDWPAICTVLNPPYPTCFGSKQACAHSSEADAGLPVVLLLIPPALQAAKGGCLPCIRPNMFWGTQYVVWITHSPRRISPMLFLSQSDSLLPNGLQQPRLSCPSSSPRAYSNSCPLSQWCHPTIPYSVIPFPCLQSFSASGFFPMSQLLASGGQRIGDAASASVLPMNIQGWFPLGLTGPLAVQGTLFWIVFNSKASILQYSAFFMVQISHPYMNTGKKTKKTKNKK